MTDKFYYKIINDTANEVECYVSVDLPVKPEKLCEILCLKGYRAEPTTKKKNMKTTQMKLRKKVQIMTDKLTDNEIIEALESEIHLAEYVDSDYCSNVNLEIIKSALDLITRQQAEIESLKADKIIAERHEKDARELFKDVVIQLKTVKSEAVKEFAERLKNEIINDTAYACDSTQHSGYYDYQIKIGDIPEYIDNLLKELLGENDDS